jgi:hypothetical protein
MTAAAYSDALASAYSGRTPESVIGAVKQVVVNQLREMDPRVEIESTDFFNHTFAPDFVLHWKSEQTSRQVFVRQAASDPYFAQEMLRVTDKSPIVFSLEPTAGHMRLGKSTEADARENDTLLTDAPGLSEIAERRADSKVLDVAAPSILQGGRGVLDEARATIVASGIAHGFVAAASLATNETRQAVSLFRYFFKSSYASRLTQFLRAVWVGAGGDFGSFPGTVGADRELSAEALTFLLQVESNADLSFWRRVGYGLTIDKLGSLQVESSSNLDLLITANLDRLRARAVRAEERNSQEEVVEDQSTWQACSDYIAWQGSRKSFLFVQAKSSLRHRETSLPGIELRDLIARAWRNKIAVESLEIVNKGRVVSYGVTAGSRSRDVTYDDELGRLVESLGQGAIARKATVSVAVQRRLVCDFEELVASGRSGAKFSIVELLRLAAPLLAELSSSDLQSLAELIVDSESVADQPPLF